jgi:hypothetical protein
MLYQLFSAGGMCSGSAGNLEGDKLTWSLIFEREGKGKQAFGADHEEGHCKRAVWCRRRVRWIRAGNVK